MQKINFTDTTITQKPYVTINNVNYEVHDGIYTGGTDLNAQTFNTMQNNIEQAINAIYPVGSIYITANATNPSVLFGGTWEQLKGKFLVGVDSSDTDFETSGKTGGEKTHILKVDEMPSHNHLLYGSPYGSADWVEGGVQRAKYDVNQKTASNTYPIGPVLDTGGSKAHNNLPPYMTVYMWKRIL